MSFFFADLQDVPTTPESKNTENKVQVPHDETASEKSVADTPSDTPTPRHTIELDRNVTIKLGNIIT